MLPGLKRPATILSPHAVCPAGLPQTHLLLEASLTSTLLEKRIDCSRSSEMTKQDPPPAQ